MKCKNFISLAVLSVMLANDACASQKPSAKGFVHSATDKTMTLLENKSTQKVATLAGLGVATYYGYQCVHQACRLVHNKLRKAPQIVAPSLVSVYSELSEKIEQTNVHLEQVDKKILIGKHQNGIMNTKLNEFSRRVQRNKEELDALEDSQIRRLETKILSDKQQNDEMNAKFNDLIQKVRRNQEELDGLIARQTVTTENMQLIPLIQARMEEQTAQLDIMYCQMSKIQDNIAGRQDVRAQFEAKELEEKDAPTLADMPSAVRVPEAQMACAAAAASEQ